MIMKFASIRLVTNDVERLASFYGRLTGVPATRLAPEFAEVRLEGATLAISGERLIQQFNRGAAIAGANHSLLLEFEIDDVDAVRSRLNDASIECVMEPTDMPWGNRSLLLRDPDGNVVNVFARPKAR
ncbi:MAG: VOC family protein [Polyangiaceae bacterium]